MLSALKVMYIITTDKKRCSFWQYVQHLLVRIFFSLYPILTNAFSYSTLVPNRERHLEMHFQVYLHLYVLEKTIVKKYIK